MCLYSNAYDAYLFLETKESKNLEYLTPAIYNDHANVIKFMKVSSNSTKSENAEIQTTSFSKESVENGDLFKPVLNNIMTTYK